MKKTAIYKRFLAFFVCIFMYSTVHADIDEWRVVSDTFTSVDSCNIKLVENKFPDFIRSKCFEKTTGKFYYYICSDNEDCWTNAQDKIIWEWYSWNNSWSQASQSNQSILSEKLVQKMDKVIWIIQEKKGSLSPQKYSKKILKFKWKLEKLKNKYDPNSKKWKVRAYILLEINKLIEENNIDLEKINKSKNTQRDSGAFGYNWDVDAKDLESKLFSDTNYNGYPLMVFDNVAFEYCKIQWYSFASSYTTIQKAYTFTDHKMYGFLHSRWIENSRNCSENNESCKQINTITCKREKIEVVDTSPSVNSWYTYSGSSWSRLSQSNWSWDSSSTSQASTENVTIEIETETDEWEAWVNAEEEEVVEEEEEVIEDVILTAGKWFPTEIQTVYIDITKKTDAPTVIIEWMKEVWNKRCYAWEGFDHQDPTRCDNSEDSLVLKPSNKKTEKVYIALKKENGYQNLVWSPSVLLEGYGKETTQWCAEWYWVDGNSKRDCSKEGSFRKMTEFDDRLFYSKFLWENKWNFRIKNDGYSFFEWQKLHVYFKDGTKTNDYIIDIVKTLPVSLNGNTRHNYVLDLREVQDDKYLDVKYEEWKWYYIVKYNSSYFWKVWIKLKYYFKTPEGKITWFRIEAVE